MPYMAFMNSPQYQKLLLKVNRMRPEQMAVLNGLLVEGNPAEAEMKKQITLGRMAEQKKGGEERLALKTRDIREVFPLREKAFDVRTGLREAGQAQRLDLGTRRIESSYGNRIRGMESARDLRLADIEESQKGTLPAMLISGANLLTSAGLGYASKKAAERYDDRMDALLKSIEAMRGSYGG